jgi:DNA mismatch repair protein MutL
VALVFIEVDPAAVDVNVHPQKLEVRFSDPRSVQEAVGAAVARALTAAPWRQQQAGPASAQVQAEYAQAIDRFLARAQTAPAFLEPQAPLQVDGPLGRPAFGTARPTLDTAPPARFFGQLTFIGVLARRFWLTESPAGSLVVIDPRAVSERIALSSLLVRHQKGQLATAPRTLFGARLGLGPTERDRVLEAAPRLVAVGVEVEDFGPGSVSVLRVPAEVEALDPATWLLELACAKDDLARLEILAREVGRFAAVNVTHDEARARLSALDDVAEKVHATATRVVVRDLPLLELERS